MAKATATKNYDSLIKPYRFFGLSVSGDVSFLEWLAKEEKALQRINERHCNYGVSKAGETRHENRCKDTVESIELAMPKLKGLVKINSDPRGAAIKVTPYIDTSEHDTKHGCYANPKYSEVIRSSGIATDWGGYGMLAPQHQ